MRYPWAVLSAWIAIVAVLGVVGLGIDSRLSSSGLQVSGSESSQVRALIGGNFGDAATVPAALHLAGRAAWWTPNLGVEHATPMPTKLAWEAPARAA